MEASWLAALCAEGELGGQCGVEGDDGVGGHRTVLGGTEGQHVDAGLPGHLGRGGAEVDKGIGEARAVHVDAQTGVVGDGGQAADLLQGVDAAALGGLADAHRGRLHAVYVTGPATRRRGQRVGVDLAVVTRDGDEFGAAGEELRCAAFVVVDMAVGVGQHAAPGRGEGGQAQAVGCGAGGDDEDIDIPLEDLAQPAAGVGGEGVVSVRQDLPGGRFGNGLGYLRGGSGHVVADEGATGRGGGDGRAHERFPWLQVLIGEAKTTVMSTSSAPVR